MKTEIRVAPQVQEFVRSRAPQPRQALRKAIKGLAKEEGDIKALEGKLAGWHRLRVSSYRVLYKETAEGGVRILNCIYANHRSVVYEMFQQLLVDELAF
jgi:mRNA-degrading endonuclease RelE of RelBE toxin-antitoxin system